MVAALTFIPSPSGEGTEGWGRTESATSDPVDSPHPNPSPEREGLFRIVS